MLTPCARSGERPTQETDSHLGPCRITLQPRSNTQIIRSLYTSLECPTASTKLPSSWPTLALARSRARMRACLESPCSPPSFGASSGPTRSDLLWLLTTVRLVSAVTPALSAGDGVCPPLFSTAGLSSSLLFRFPATCWSPRSHITTHSIPSGRHPDGVCMWSLNASTLLRVMCRMSLRADSSEHRLLGCDALCSLLALPHPDWASFAVLCVCFLSLSCV